MVHDLYVNRIHSRILDGALLSWQKMFGGGGDLNKLRVVNMSREHLFMRHSFHLLLHKEKRSINNSGPPDARKQRSVDHPLLLPDYPTTDTFFSFKIKLAQ